MTLTTRRWTYICPATNGGARELYDLEHDPEQARNVIDREPEVAAGLHKQLLDFLQGVEMPPERLALYREYPSHSANAPLLPGDVTLHVVTDHRGLRLAFPRRSEAEECLGPALPPQQIQHLTLRQLREEAPEALVHVQAQYYRVDDLV